MPSERNFSSIALMRFDWISDRMASAFVSAEHDDRKGRHYYTRSERRFARSNDDVHTSEGSKNVYSSDDPCGRHGRGHHGMGAPHAAGSTKPLTNLV